MICEKSSYWLDMRKHCSGQIGLQIVVNKFNNLLTIFIGNSLTIAMHNSGRTIRGRIALKTLIPIVVTSLFLATSSTVFAEEQVSTVQRAAAERLIGKLGDLRGSVKPEDKAIFVTQEMVRPSSNSNGASDGIGSVPKMKKPVKLKLPPIVLEMGNDIDEFLEKILSGKVRQKTETENLNDEPFDLHDALTIARASNSKYSNEETLAFDNQAFDNLENYLAPPSR